MRALILDQAQDRGSLVAARALARDGWTLGSATSNARGLVERSRVIAHRHRVPAADATSDELLAALNNAIDEGGYEVVFSCIDAVILKLSLHREELRAAFPYADHATLVRSFDKLELTREAQRAGLAVPRTEPAEDRELAGLGAAQVVIKPRFTFLEGAADRLSASVEPTPERARARARALRDAGAEPIVQEHIAGRLMAFTAVTDRDARMVARVQQVADQIWPLGVGVSARAHTVAIDESLSERVGRLLEELGWFGLAELQFLLGPDSVPRLIDMNGRFYGSLALAVAAGPNLPAIWARLATGRAVGHVEQARPGVRYQWLSGDLRAGLAAARGVGRVGAALGCMVRAPGAVHSVWRSTDPWPAVGHYGSKILTWIRPS
jgi:predicted ATP-grasp superfamily ATP-dependent carboligase